MATVAQIQELKDKYIKEIYSQTRKEQKDDNEYIDDTFQPGVRTPHKVLRLGLGYEIVNSPAEQIVTSNPQAFIEVSKETKLAVDAAKSIAMVVNGWIGVLKRENPNPFKECIKNCLGRGESYIKILHNPSNQDSLPLIFQIPDSMVVYGSPDEDENGIPRFVMVFYERQIEDVILRYPDWKDPKHRLQGEQKSKLVEWFEYWSATERYFEADGDAVIDLQPNVYGCTPFVRKYSGFGRRSPDGELASLIRSDLRHSRGLINEITTMYSDIASVMHLSAHKPKTIMSTGEINEEAIRTNLSFESYDLNILDKLPPDFKIEDIQLDQPTAEAFQHAQTMMVTLMRRHPLISVGFPLGTSGRQQDMTSIAAMRRYDTVVENTENQWATAFEKALYICKQLDILPIGLKKGDLDYKYKCVVKLKARDVIEDERVSLAGRTMVEMAQLSLRTNLIKFQNMTAEEADDEIDQILAEQYMFRSPDIAELMQLRAAEKSGMSEDVELLRQRRMELEKRVKEFPLGRQFGSQGGEPRTGNIQSPEGLEDVYARGQRRPARGA